jgi:hypothetical protein
MTKQEIREVIEELLTVQEDKDLWSTFITQDDGCKLLNVENLASYIKLMIKNKVEVSHA